MMASTFNQTNEACQVTKLRRWHAIAWSMESMLWKAFPMQLRWSTRCLGFSGQRERKTSSGRAHCDASKPCLIEPASDFKQTPRAFAQIWARPRLWSSGTWHLEESGKIHHDHFRGSWVETALGRYKAPQAHNLQSLANTQVSACRSQWWQWPRLKSKCNSGRMMLVHHESEKGSDQNTGLKNRISWGIELLKASDEALGDYTESKMSLSSSHLCQCCFLASST